MSGFFRACRLSVNDKSGAIAPLFALIVLALVSVVGFGVDFRRMHSGQAHLQDAVDASVLAGAKEYIALLDEKESDRQAAAIVAANDYFTANMADAGSGIKNTTIGLTFNPNGEVTGAAEGDLDLAFGGMFNMPSVKLAADAVAIAGSARRLEIMLVLDNSTSMFDTGDSTTEPRMTTMRKAAKGFVNTLFDEAIAPGLIQVGVIPWATQVNIMSEEPDTWNDAAAGAGTPPARGSAKIPPYYSSRESYLKSKTNGSYNNAKLTADFAPVGWRGCITAYPNERKVNSSGAVTQKLTDAAPNAMKWPVGLVEPEIRRQRVKYDNPNPKPKPKPKPNPSPSPSPKPKPKPKPKPAPGPQGALNPNIFPVAYEGPWSSEAYGEGVTPISVKTHGGNVDGCVNIHKKNIAECKFVGDWNANDHTKSSYIQPRKSQCETKNCYVAHCKQQDEQFGDKGRRNVYLPIDLPCSNTKKKIQTNNLDACVSDPNEFDYFATGGKACAVPALNEFKDWDEKGMPISGPNILCPSSMLGMSGSRPQIMDKLDHLYPVPGGTLADIGLMWGLRAMSDNSKWTSFFRYPNELEPKQFKSADARKIMILLTDGKNDAPFDFDGYYGCLEKSGSYDGAGRWRAGNCPTANGISNVEDVAMNNLMLDACQAIVEDYKVELYTIAVDMPAGSNEVTLLETCAGNSDRAFNIKAAELDETFQAIAEQSLHLSE
ncbi:MAG: TadE/TadG family type IV pilus assembly protein [Pseudomonadota bacterium]